MGNRGPSLAATRCDFVSELPPELVAKVFSFLTVSGVLKCQLVCKDWRQIIPHLRPYWTRKLLDLGVPPVAISLGVASLPPNHRDLYLTTRRRLQEARTQELVSCEAMCYPYYSWQGVEQDYLHFMHRQNIVIRRDCDEEASFLRVEEVVCGGVVYVKRLGYVQLCDNTLVVKWTHYSGSDGCVYWIDSLGVCRGHDLRNDREVCTIEMSKVLVKGGRGEGTREIAEERLVCKGKERSASDEKWEETDTRFRGLAKMERCLVTTGYAGWSDAEVQLAECESCSMAVLCRARSFMRDARCSHIKLQVVRLGGGHVQEVATIETSLTHTSSCQNTRPRPRGGVTKMSLSGSGGTQGGMCIHHYVILQPMVVVSVKWSRDTKPPYHLVTCTNCTCDHTSPRPGGRDREEAVSMSSGCKDTEIEASVCGEQVGQIHGKVLCVWEPSKDHERLDLVSSAEIAIQLQGDCQVVLAALGKFLSLIRQESRGIARITEDIIYIVHTTSGQMLNRVSCVLPATGIGSTLATRCYLLSREAQRWLSDLTSVWPSTLLTVVFSIGDSDGGGGGRLAFISIRPKKTQEQPHRVHTINYGFQN